MGSASFHFVKFLRSSIIKNNPNVFLITKKLELFQIGCKTCASVEHFLGAMGVVFRKKRVIHTYGL